jgi:hypothetical protein
VRLVGRVLAADEDKVACDDDIIATTVASDIKLAGLLARIDDFIARNGLAGAVGEPEPFEPTWPAAFDLRPETVHLRAAGIVGDLGHRVPARVFLAERTGSRPSRRDSPPRRHHAGPRALRARDAFSAAPQLRVHRRRGRRRRVSRGTDRVRRRVRARAGVRARMEMEESTMARSLTDLKPSYDAIVVGARCAGAATALLLARRGLDVLLLEQGARGADTLSTLALMRGGVLQLARWGLLDAIRDAGTPAIRTTTFHYDGEPVAIRIKPRDGVDALYAPRRTLLDPLLADAAEAAGAQVVYGVRCADLVRDDHGRVRGVVVEGRDRVPRPVAAGIVIGPTACTRPSPTAWRPRRTGPGRT